VSGVLPEAAAPAHAASPERAPRRVAPAQNLALSGAIQEEIVVLGDISYDLVASK
jgi:hypothetical protein